MTQALRMVVISTGYDTEAPHMCLQSVSVQRGVEVTHRFVDASLQSPPLPMLRNLIDLASDLPDDAIIVSLDLDDWLARPDALRMVYDAHAAGAWVTYGSYVTAEGRDGIACATQVSSCRASPWGPSHLKTYRAGLLRRIRVEDLQDEGGAWLTNACDMLVMFPVLEMAGQDRCTFIDVPLVIYNSRVSYEATHGLDGLDVEREAARYARSLPPYTRVESLVRGVPFDEALQ